MHCWYVCMCVHLCDYLMRITCVRGQMVVSCFIDVVTVHVLLSYAAVIEVQSKKSLEERERERGGGGVLNTCTPQLRPETDTM